MRGLILALAALAGCSGSGGEVVVVAFGLDNRLEVTTLTFPTGLPQPGPLTAVRAFPNLGFNRPVFLTAPSDGTNRIFVVEQDGRIYVFANDRNVASRTRQNFVFARDSRRRRPRDGGCAILRSPAARR